MNKKILNQIKKNLQKEKQDLTIKCSQEIENIDIDGDETDEIQGNILFQVQSSLSKRNSDRLNLINLALSKINKKDFGICEDCEEEITEKRLLINPCTTVCVLCAEEREMSLKRR